ncbi:MAG: ABC transporter ATP-binding protein [Acidobacteria bacterium]|nr:ABC transporter ATP-binding protein [Acidobacteriota bacterium]
MHLALNNVSLGYGNGRVRVQALDNVSMKFQPGTLNLIVGPSGSGKTTLLCVLGCILTPDSGSVYIEGADVSRLAEAARADLRRRHIGFIFQAFRLLHSLSALENVLVTAAIAGERGEESRQAAVGLLAELGLEDKLALKPDALSGGEKQRVAIARCLLKNPTILLADEPTASLDTNTGHQIAAILRRLAEQQQRTVVVVSHDTRWRDLAHRTIELRDGQVKEKGDCSES